MKLNLHNINISGKVNMETVLPKSGGVSMDKIEQLDDFMKKIISKIKESKAAIDADIFLYDLSHHSDEFEAIDECLRYRHKDFNIVTCLEYFGKPVVENLKKLNNLNISSAPDLITAINKDEKLYIITKNIGTQNGNLKPYFIDGTQKVSKEAKLSAYNDMQKLTKAGLIDDQNLRGGSWYYTPEHKILLPNWEHLRQIRQDESPKQILEQYYNIIFRD